MTRETPPFARLGLLALAPPARDAYLNPEGCRSRCDTDRLRRRVGGVSGLLRLRSLDLKPVEVTAWLSSRDQDILVRSAVSKEEQKAGCPCRRRRVASAHRLAAVGGPAVDGAVLVPSGDGVAVAGHAVDDCAVRLVYMPKNRLRRTVGPGSAEEDSAVSIYVRRIGRFWPVADLDGAVHEAGDLGFRPSRAGSGV